MSTPYITPGQLTSAPTGIPWNIIPLPRATSEQQLAEQTNICWRASGIVDGKLNQTVRATLDSEVVHGPSFRLTVDSSGVARALTKRWPVLDVVSAQVSPRATIPRAWQVIPADAIIPEEPPLGVYGSTGFGAGGAGGNAVLVAPGFISWMGGRNGYALEMYYLNGWPHAGLTATVVAGVSTIQVDDVTAFTGAQAFIYDGINSEQIQVESVTANTLVAVPGNITVPAGPGTLTLASPLQYGHTAATPTQVVISAIPQDILWAVVLHATIQVLESGASALTAQTVNPSSSKGGKGFQDLEKQADIRLKPYKRVI